MGRRRGTSAFPVARIKKMMQADDDVGKIATVTPMLVAKALECMMELVVTEAARLAIDRRSRTVTPLHLKACVMRNDDFDFLRHVFNAVQGHLDPDAPLPDLAQPAVNGGTRGDENERDHEDERDDDELRERNAERDECDERDERDDDPCYRPSSSSSGAPSRSRRRPQARNASSAASSTARLSSASSMDVSFDTLARSHSSMGSVGKRPRSTSRLHQLDDLVSRPVRAPRSQSATDALKSLPPLTPKTRRGFHSSASVRANDVAEAAASLVAMPTSAPAGNSGTCSAGDVVGSMTGSRPNSSGFVDGDDEEDYDGEEDDDDDHGREREQHRGLHERERARLHLQPQQGLAQGQDAENVATAPAVKPSGKADRVSVHALLS